MDATVHSESRPRPLTAYGWNILAPVLLLCAIGLSCIFAVERGQNGPYTTTIKQVAYLLIGLGLMWLMCTLNYLHYGRLAYTYFGIMLVLLALLVLAHFLPLGLIMPRIRGACRWIVLGPGVSLQPSEFMKVVYVLALARYLRFRKNFRTLRGLVEPFVLTLVPMLLILLEPDLGTVMLFMPVLFTMLFAAGAKIRHLLLIVLMGLAALPLFYFTVMKDYQKQRIEVLLRQGDEDPRWRMNEGYQLAHSKIALGSGGMFGTVLREGLTGGPYVSHRFLPDRHNDFIFAIVGHQYGFVGCAVVVGCFVWILLVGLEIASRTSDPFGRLIAVGLSTMLATQALINVAMTMGLMPITGLTLPFVSAGGSSLLTCFLAVGILINVNQRRPIIIGRKPFEFGDEE